MAQKKNSYFKVVGAFILVIIISCMFCVVIFLHTANTRILYLSNHVSGNEFVEYSIDYLGDCNHSVSIVGLNQNLNAPDYALEGNGKYTDYFDIFGWALVRGEDIKKFNISVLLKDKESRTDKYIKLSTEALPSTEITEKFDTDACDYGYAKFLATVSKKDLKPNAEYEIYILYQNDDYDFLIKTDNVLSK